MFKTTQDPNNPNKLHVWLKEPPICIGNLITASYENPVKEEVFKMTKYGEKLDIHYKPVRWLTKYTAFVRDQAVGTFLSEKEAFDSMLRVHARLFEVSTRE